MTRIVGRPTITATVTIELTEAEAGALCALVGYGSKEFLKVFYEHMGKAYLEPYESGLCSLFDSVRGSLSGFLAKLRDTRKAWSKEEGN